jgi:hypothetical protein
MKYIPKKIGNRWTTELCEKHGNGGIHDQSQLKSAIKMIEDAVDTWDSPKLMHIILTGATVPTYTLFMDSMKREMLGMKAYKAAVETDTRKGQHIHWMLITDAATPVSVFDQDNDSSPISRLITKIQRTEPEFNAMVAQPRYSTPYIPLNDATLNDAVDWFSYALKARSKPAKGTGCHRSGVYLSSRPARRVCINKSSTPKSIALHRENHFWPSNLRSVAIHPKHIQALMRWFTSSPPPLVHFAYTPVAPANQPSSSFLEPPKINRYNETTLNEPQGQHDQHHPRLPTCQYTRAGRY